MIGDIILVDARARCGPRSLKKFEVLQEERHAGERTGGKPVVDLPLGMVVVFHDHRVDVSVDLRRAGDRLVQKLAGADLFAADEIGEADCVIAAVFLERHF